jgi:ectoine hydroxylase-related dioxygenase (phytanoyl-CoA dioxygenase family)
MLLTHSDTLPTHCDTRSSTLTRAVTDEEAARFHRDGVVMLPGLLGPDGIARLRELVDEELQASWRVRHPGAPAPAAGRFFNDGFLWRRHDLIRELCLSSLLPPSAARLMGSPTARLLMDEVFVKEPGTQLPVPWHTDVSYWPMAGRQMLSFWIALDQVNAESGAVQFRAGSFTSAEIHRPTSFLDRSEHGLPTAATSPGTIVSWNMAPGDAVAFHAYTLHYSPPNSTADRRRRAWSVRYAGADVRYDPREGTSAMMTVDGLAAGAELPDDLYPVAWRLPAERIASHEFAEC